LPPPAKPSTKTPAAPPVAEPPKSRPGAAEPTDHEQTSVMPVAAAQLLARLEPEEEGDHLETMRRDPGDVPAGGPDRVSGEASPTSATVAVAVPSIPPNPAVPRLPDVPADDARPTTPENIPLAVGVRVRIHATEGGAWMVLDDGRDTSGMAAIVVPISPDEDVRTLFVRR
jgi:hypothetical protein